MKSVLIKILFFLSALFTVFTASAQQASPGGSVSGKLIDGANGQPLSFATALLVRKSDNHPVRSIQSDINGNFSLTEIPNGLYVFHASYIGYAAFVKDSVSVTPSTQAVSLGSIKLRPAKGLLKEVTITAQKSQMSLGIDKKSFNVDQSLVSQGGSVTDLLTNVPSVQVDVDGNISLRGSTNVKVLINGKASALTGGDLADILQSIPASAIETIEVITNPSSKYQAEGDSGIINIILKKNTQKGFTGSASEPGTQHTYNGTFNLAYQNSKVNVYANYSYRKGDRIGNGSIDKITNETDGTVQTQNQVSDQQFIFTGQNIRSGIDVYLDPKTTLGFSNNINIRDRNRTQTGGTFITQNDTLLQSIDQNNISNGHGTNMDLSLDLDHKYKKKDEELTANVTYSVDKNNNFDNLNSDYNYYSPVSSYFPSVQNNTTIGRQHNWNFQSDFTLPLKNGRFEAGLRSTINNSNNNYISDTLNTVTNNFDHNPFLSNDFIYKENINAIYANYQHTFGKFSIQGGLRLEDANISTQLTDSVTTNSKQDYWRLYPTLFLTEKLSDDQTVQLSYSRRVTRPQDRMLSPFIDESNRLNYSQGNPNLLPQDTHSLELSYINYWRSVTLTSSLYYRYTAQNIQRITTPLTPGNVDTTITRFENLNSASNAGYELIVRVSPSPMFDITGNLNIYYQYLQGDAALHLPATSGYSWNGNITANIKPIKKLGIQIRADYQGAQVIPQGEMKAIYGVDGGLRYDITKKLSLSGNVRDIFNTRKYISDINYSEPTFTSAQVSDRRFATRVMSVTLAYRFGNNGIPQKRKNKDKDQQQQPQDQDMPDDLNPQQGQGAPPAGTGTMPQQGKGAAKG